MMILRQGQRLLVLLTTTMMVVFGTVESSSSSVTPLHSMHVAGFRGGVEPKAVDLVELQHAEKLVAQKKLRMDRAMTLLGIFTTCFTTLYGGILMRFANEFPGQVLVLTVIRAAGYIHLERAAWEMRRNLSRSMRAAALHAPSLLLMKRALRDLKRRRTAAKALLRQTKLAKADGIVTPQEARKLRNMQIRQVRRINRDIRRLRRGSSVLAKLWRKLDLQEGTEIMRRLLFMLTAVLASGHSIHIVGRVISAYCHFWSLGQFFMETNRRVGMPISRLIIKHTIDPMAMTISDQEPSLLRLVLGFSMMYSLSAFLILFRYNLGLKLNASFLAATFIVRGITGILAVLHEVKHRDQQRDDDDDDDESDNEKQDEKEKQAQQQRSTTSYAIPGLDRDIVVSQFLIGISTILLATAAMYCSYVLDTAPPPWLQPLVAVEQAIDKLVILADKM